MKNYLTESMKSYMTKLDESCDKNSVMIEDLQSDIEEERNIQKYLNDNNLYGDVEVYSGEVRVNIEWGDWKHEHWRCDLLMNNIGYKLEDEEITEEDESDTYSAIHIYKRINLKDQEKVLDK